LPHERHVVADTPILDRLAITEADNVYVVHGDITVRRRDAHQVTRVPTVQGAVDDDSVAFANDLVDLPALVTEHPSQTEHRLLDAGKTLRLVRACGMIDQILRDHLCKRLDVSIRNDLLPRSTCSCLEFFGHDDLSLLELSRVILN